MTPPGRDKLAQSAKLHRPAPAIGNELPTPSLALNAELCLPIDLGYWATGYYVELWPRLMRQVSHRCRWWGFCVC
jgi:hypothetical protein